MSNFIRQINRRHQIENLERRLLLASHSSANDVKGLVDVGHGTAEYFYFANGKPVALEIMADRMAVAWSGDSDANLPPAVKHLRNAGSQLQIYSVSSPVSIGPSLQDYVRSSNGFQMELPVFWNSETGSEAVLIDEVIVALASDTNPEDFFTSHPLIQSAIPLAGTTDQYIVKVKGSGVKALQAANDLGNDQRLRFASPNFYQSWESYAAPNDPRLGNQWHLINSGQGGGVVDADSDLDEAWDINAGGSSDIVIGVVDDGVAIDHPDLLNRMNPGEIPGDGIDNDGNGWIDDVYGWNFVDNNNQSWDLSTDDPHGTSVAGVAAARGDNSLGVAGASYNSPVLSAKIFAGPSVASDANIASAIYYISGRTADGSGTWRSADIANHSWGGGGFSQAIADALQWATDNGRQGEGMLHLFATGNDFGVVSQPAVLSTSIDGVIAVGATNNFAERSNYSNFGPEVDFVTPSNDTRSGYLAIDTTDLPGSDGYSTDDYTGTGAAGFGGTSSATPLATGIAALAMAELESQGLSLSPQQFRALLRNNTDLIGDVQYDTDTGHNDEFGQGRLNAGRLLEGIGNAEISVVTESEELQDGNGTIDFGDVIVGQTATARLRVRNQGTQALNLTDALLLNTTTNDFAITQVIGDPVLQVGEATTFEIAFTPSSFGPKVDSGQILSNDVDEAIFDFQVIGSGAIANVSGIVFEDFNNNGQKDEGERALPDQVVYLDTDLNGELTSLSDTFTNDVPVPISDNSTVESTLEVSGATPGTTLEVTVNISHTYVSDLDLVLVSPDGQEYLLASEVGGAGVDFIDTVFADDALTPIEIGEAPFTGRFLPVDSLLSATQGNVNGTWRLQVTDSYEEDTGRIEGWSLSFASSEPIAVTDALGFYSFLQLPLGGHDVRISTPSNWISTDNGLQQVQINAPQDEFGDRRFALAKQDRAYGRVFDDVNQDGVQDESETGISGVEVLLDQNGNGTVDPASTDSFLVDPFLPIVDEATTSSPQQVAGLSNESVFDLDLRIDLSHTFVGDLEVELINPSGESATLFSFVGGGGSNFFDTVFDDDATQPINLGSAPFTGTFRPQEPLSNLLTGDLNGNWILSVNDAVGGDVGVINEWELIFSSREATDTTDAWGNYQLDLPEGQNSLQVLLPLDRSFTLPATGNRQLTANDQPHFDVDFGLITPVTVPSVQEVVLNQSDPSRSVINEIQVTFDSEVAAADAAFRLTERQSGDQVTGLQVSHQTLLGKTVSTIRFTPGEWVDNMVDGMHSLADGTYRLEILADQVQSVSSGQRMNGDHLYGEAATDRFFRLFGDLDGDRDVDGLDLGGFGQTFLKTSSDPAYNINADADRDGDVDGLDLGAFGQRFLQTMPH